MNREVRLAEHAMRWTERGDSHAGEGVPVLAVHSSGMSSRQWRKLEAELPPGHRLVAPDLLGYGESSAWPADKAYSQLAIGPASERFHFVFDQLGIERVIDAVGEPVHLVGHSYGAFLALLVALHHPARVRSISVFEPVSFGVLRSTGDHEALATIPSGEGDPWPDAPEALEAWLEGFVDYWNGPGGWRAQPETFRESFRRAGIKMVGEVRTLGVDPTPLAAYRTLTMPVLLMGGERSTLAAKRVLALLASAMPNAKRIEIAGAGHMGPLTHSAQVNAAILENIARGS
jgi:pimeloyl-ACP methyl ester carboxylesterase